MLSSIPCRLLSELRWVAISSVNRTGGMRQLRRSSSSPMELTVELMGSKPFNPKLLAERVGFYMEISAMLLQTDRFLLSRRIARDLGHTTTAIILHTNHSGYPDFVDFWYGWYGLLRPATFWTRTPLQDAEPDYAIQQGNNRNCYGAGGSEVQILSPRPIIPKQLIGLATIPNFGFPQFGSVWVQLANLPPSAPLLLLPLATNANRPLG